MKKLESAMRRIYYGKLETETYEFADILSRLLHANTNKGQISNLGQDLVACTVGLWRVFKGSGVSAAERHRLLAEFEPSARRLFNPTKPVSATSAAAVKN